MTEFNQIQIINEYELFSTIKNNFLENIKKIIIDTNSILEGNSFYYHNTLNLNKDLYTKQLNLFWAGKQAINKICEIGFNAGHSTMLMLLGRQLMVLGNQYNSNLNFTIFDIGHHKYTNPCFEYIKNSFNNVNFEYIEGDSIITIPKWIDNNKFNLETYDVVHIDGGHSIECFSNDLKNANLLVRKGGLIIIDDTNMQHINDYLNDYLYKNIDKYKELNILYTLVYPHRIIKKI